MFDHSISPSAQFVFESEARSLAQESLPIASDAFEQQIFENVVNDLVNKGMSIQPQAIPFSLIQSLKEMALTKVQTSFHHAAIGRHAQQQVLSEIRSDKICWIEANSSVEQQWLTFCQQLQDYINRNLYLGLKRFESHFAVYQPGDHYTWHKDAFKGKSSRVVTLVTYLNDNWNTEFGGELEIECLDGTVLQVQPEAGTLVCFLSSDFPHRVLPSTRDRYSIAGWFRIDQ